MTATTKTFLTAATLALSTITSAQGAAIAITAYGTALPTETFNSLAASGSSSTVPAGWEFSEAGGNTTYTAGTGSIATGDTYSFGSAASSDRAFGTLRSGSNIPTIGASFTNSVADGVLQSLTISYHGEQWRLGNTGRADRLDFAYSLNATSLTTGTWIDVNALDFTGPTTTGTVGPLDGKSSANSATVTATISGLSVAPGATIWIRFSDFEATGADDGLAVDDFDLTANGVVPEPTTLAALLGLGGLLTARRRV